MKLKSLLPALLFSLFIQSAIAQITIEEEKSDTVESKTQGFFVKNGQQKIDSLVCYTFEDLIVAFDLKEEHFDCAKIKIEIKVGTNAYSYYIDQNEFTKQFKDKDYAYFKVFSSTDMAEKSEWTNTAGENLSRSRIQFAKLLDSKENSKLSVTIERGKITGEQTVYKTLSDGRTVANTYDTWDWVISTEFSIDLKNRKKLNPYNLLYGIYPKKPTEDGNCYK